MKKAGKIILAVVLSICLFASLGVNVLLLRNTQSQADDSQAQNDKVNRFISDQLAKQAEEAKKENTYEEDGYKVGEQYEIRSTKHISDAYISGDESKLSEEDKKTLALAKKILKKIIKDDMTVYEKEEAVYNWMFKNIGQGSGSVVSLPSTSGENFTPAGVLNGRNAVCVGYATTFRMFMQMFKLECHVVHNEYHSWDLVKLDDGKWYHTDIYTDVSANSQYRNFNMTDAIARCEHDWDPSCLPVADGIKYSYPMQHHKQVKDIYTVPKELKNLLDKKKSNGFFTFKKLTEKEMKAADVIVNQANNALMQLGGYDNYNISGSWYDGEKNSYILGIYISKYDDDTDTHIDPKITKKMTEKINSAFGTSLTPEQSSDNNYAG